jgi:hypothetical protein
MMAALMQTQPRVQWVSPTPFWSKVMDTPVEMQKPALLRFTSDTFMDDLSALLHSKPQDLHILKAKPESFRARPIGAPANHQPPAPPILKLYQPAHGHFNLISASLVCRLAGLPDRHVEGATETVSFLVRKVANGNEMAWTNDPINGKGWKTVANKKELAEYEELNPMFPVGYQQDDQRRRLFAGLVPTSSSESYQPTAAVSTPSTPPAAPLPDPRMDEAETRVLQVLQTNFLPIIAPHVSSDPNAKKMLERGQKEASLFLILDLAEILDTYLPTLWNNHILTGTAPAGNTPDLYDLLNEATVQGTLTWRVALKTIWEQRDALMKGDPVTVSFNLINARWNATKFSVGALRAHLKTAFGPYTEPAVPPVSSVTPTASMRKLPKFDVGPNVRYVVRCVYQRPHCTPLIPPVVSAPTEEFIISNFFDPDAPARPIRIPMPLDTTIAGLRQFPKSVGIIMSDKLREQVASVTDLQKALDGELASGESFDLGVICSFSIPVITIVALVVMIIFIALLNIVFWWMPLFRICLPIPVKAKA